MLLFLSAMSKMTGIDHYPATPTDDLWKEIADIIEEISDKVGEADLGEGCLLKFEGWSPVCFPETLASPETRKGKNVETEITHADGEETYYRYAEEESCKIIEKEWKPELRERGYGLVEGGYDSGGLYGRTWALFKRSGRTRRRCALENTRSR